MNNEIRNKLIEELQKLGDKFPEWRFGQLVDNVSGWADVATWDVEDEQLLEAVRQFVENERETQSSVPAQFVG